MQEIEIDDYNAETTVQDNGTVYIGNKHRGKTVKVAIEVLEE